MVDDYFDLFKKIKSTKNDFQELTKKFKELKSLAVNYKGEKELEIEKLGHELNEFKTMAENNKNSYEEAMELLNKENILSLPGTFFGPNQDRFLRLAYANITRKQIVEVVDRLNASFHKPS